MAENGKRLSIPGWAISAISIAVTLLATGAWFGTKMENLNSTLRFMDYRLCRLEEANHIRPWFTCERGAEAQTARASEGSRP